MKVLFAFRCNGSAKAFKLARANALHLLMGKGEGIANRESPHKDKYYKEEILSWYR